jgi:pyrroloquinoline quinone biosynthesis protein D
MFRPAPSCRRIGAPPERSKRADPLRGAAATAAGVRLVHNEAQGGWILLAPERVFKADAIAAEIIKRCTGEVTFAELIDELAKRYAAPRERVLADVGALLRGLADKRLLEL